jgi:hypothetical protein
MDKITESRIRHMNRDDEEDDAADNEERETRPQSPDRGIPPNLSTKVRQNRSEAQE